MLERATDDDIAEVRRRLDAFTAPSFDRGIVEKLVARLEAVGGEPEGVRNPEAGYVEFANFDAPYFVREIDGPSAILFDVATRQVIGYRVYDPATTTDERAVEAQIEAQAWNCDAWPVWLHDIVHKTNEVADRLDMSSEQAHAYAVLAALAQGESRNG